jgi:hypothetical protein
MSIRKLPEAPGLLVRPEVADPVGLLEVGEREVVGDITSLPGRRDT